MLLTNSWIMYWWVLEQISVEIEFIDVTTLFLCRRWKFEQSTNQSGTSEGREKFITVYVIFF